MARVLVSPLNWGLGHATRDIPVIKTLHDHGHEVTIAACGNALSVLRQEFPDAQYIDYPDYSVAFSFGRFFVPRFCASLPFMLKAVAREHATLETILSKDRYDLVISDNRLGVFSPRVPSIFISHQLHYHLPLLYWPAELLAIPANMFLHERYDRIIVPDNLPGELSLGGKLSLPQTDVARDRVFFSGILSGTHQIACAKDLDYLVIISGPEPQRTILEKIILAKIGELEGSGVALLGSPQGPKAIVRSGDWTCIPYVSTEIKTELMNRARCIICRSGYTTLMELAELGKNQALLIPTPGQTEQEYLSWYYRQKNWYYSVNQKHLDLADDVAKTRDFPGFPAMARTAENRKRLYNELLAEYLE
jgi:hypothetical protein